MNKNQDLKTKEYQRTIAFLNRQQIDFLDKLGKDALFSKGIQPTRTKILSCLVDLLIELNISGEGLGSLEELKQRIKERVYSIQPITSRLLGSNLYPPNSLSRKTNPQVKSDPAGAGEKREFKRLKDNLEVEYRPLESLDPCQITSTEDFSIKGIRINLPEYIPPETRLELILKIPNYPEPLKVIGRVVWAKKKEGGFFTTGIHLLYIREQDKERFSKYVLG